MEETVPSETEREVSELFEQFDSSGQGLRLNYHDFYRLMELVWKSKKGKELDDDIGRFYFTATAIERPDQVSAKEVSFLLESIDSPDPSAFAQVLFRGIDRNRIGTVGSAELSNAIRLFTNKDNYVVQLLTRAQKPIESTDARLNFARFIEETTGVVIEPGCDPYPGRASGRSSCCILF